jgi:thioredoxin reductase
MQKITNHTKTNQPIIILGGGPAGMTCALQLKRYGLEPLLLEKRELGGLLWNANLVENYPGFPNGIEGSKLIQLMKKQIERIAVDVKREEVLMVDLEQEEFIVSTKNTKRKTQILVIASGTKAGDLPEGILPEARNRVFTEVWPLSDVSEKQVVIIGAGDAAFDYALNLAKKRNYVTILNRGENVKCLRLLFARAAREPRITYRAGVAVSEVKADESATRLEVRCEAKDEQIGNLLYADYVLFAIGRVPNMDFLSEEIRRRERELVESGRLYFIGDVKNELHRQVAIAAGDGLRAAMQIYSRIANENYRENR